MACHQVTDDDVNIIIAIKDLFQKPLAEIRENLEYIDEGCPHGHYVKPNEMDNDMVDTERTKLGHPLPCSAAMCHSKLRVLRSASVHYPALRNMLYNVYHARKCHATIAKIDDALQNTNALELLQLLNIKEYEELVSDDSDLSLGGECVQGVGKIFIVKGLPHIETHLEVAHAKSIKRYIKKLDQDAEYPCCSCERLFLRIDISQFKFDANKYKTATWQQLKRYMLDVDPDMVDKSLYVCKHCRPILNKDRIPNWCILNGLITEPIPHELEILNLFERQLIQRAKTFQTIVRLGTYTGKVPIYNTLKGVKGTMFILPLPMEKTLSNLTENTTLSLPDPELYILVDGHPTKENVVWQTFVDVNKVKQAVNKLRQINIFYKDLNENAVDDAAKKTIKAVSNVSSTLLEKSTKDDIDGLQAYTIQGWTKNYR